MNAFLKKQVLSFRLSVDSTLPQLAFSVQRKGQTLSLSGNTPSETLSAAYTALEQMGYRFEVTGPIAPSVLNVSAIPESLQVVTPAIARRGIRQHINFNMDVSGYPIAEAKEYIEAHQVARAVGLNPDSKELCSELRQRAGVTELGIHGIK